MQSIRLRSTTVNDNDATSTNATGINATGINATDLQKHIDRQSDNLAEVTDDTAEDEIVSLNNSAITAADQHFTRNGFPDRRYRGQRDIPEESVTNPNYTKQSQGMEDASGTHRTINGKPDRRFLENRAMSETEAQIEQARLFLEQHQKDQANARFEAPTEPELERDQGRDTYSPTQDNDAQEHTDESNKRSNNKARKSNDRKNGTHTNNVGKTNHPHH